MPFKTTSSLGPFRSLLLLASLGCAASGCGGPAESFTRAAVKGTVTLDNQPLDSATIRFVPTGDTVGPKTEFPISQGQFLASQSFGPPIGDHRVEIDVIDQQWQHDDEQAIEKLQQSPRKKISRAVLPDRYHKMSSLTATIEPTSDENAQILTFPLTSRP
ncbi:MAG TPA: hypothetical protein DDZ51_13595 [Planctomycetaceae bacterium]|nr:hypothetical protein [Planctomycetaceae bacterium]